ncbi:hypothetical protein [Streptomyces sp. NBC_00690]|uniref:hypothetical protein n=1 Tax=Streptomyces sp. NBC_00690 TaxID=2975808 RepID=UPI002E2B36BE|nr:hypothetical protein [Streptomyces sp. NBC_00690]
MTTTPSPTTTVDKALDDACATVTTEIIGVRAGSYLSRASTTTACQQARAGLPVRRSMV